MNRQNKEKVMFSKKSFTLTELLIAMVLTGLVILAVTSVDITSRRFLDAAGKESRIQDEAKIAMEHIVKNVQLGIGDITYPSTAVGAAPAADDSRGFLILDSDGKRVADDIPGSQLQVKTDTNYDGQFNSANDKIIKYTYLGASDYKIVYDPDIDTGSDEENLATDMLTSNTTFTAGSDCNEVIVTLEAQRDPSIAVGPENPKTTLTSNIILRAMSCR